MIPRIIKHNGELFALEDILLKQCRAKSFANKMKKQKIRTRIKFFDNKYCIYKQIGGKINEKNKNNSC